MMKRYIFGITILEHELGPVVLMILQPIYTSTLGLCALITPANASTFFLCVPTHSRAKLQFDFFVWVSGAVVLSQHYLPLLLGAHMLHPYFLCHLVRELPDEAWVPEFRSNTQVFTASHQGVGFAAFGRSGNTVRVEVLLLATGNGNESDFLLA